ncbi:MAG: MgtC/SapB family protein [Bacteroides sp.]|nr:MgtC/SapB family protein [Prevotella sp.]MCM1407121.1 MgtC/SapB family protein [Treponema brennaborense]MCM1470273.1 MgtC/SapB family protein [Bacteroides sp.]
MQYLHNAAAYMQTIFSGDLMQSGQLSCGIIFFRVFLSFIAGFVLGLERKFGQHQFGLRTLILISESSTLLMMLSILMGSYAADASRIAAQIVSGIGFLGGGAILHKGLNVKGLTSASIIWISASLGMAIGAGMYLSAMTVLAVSIAALILLEKVESRLFPATQSKRLLLVFTSDTVDFSAIQAALTSHGILISTIDASKKMSEQKICLAYSIKAPEKIDILDLASSLKTAGTLEEITLTD